MVDIDATDDLEVRAKTIRLEDEADNIIRETRARILRRRSPEDIFYASFAMGWELKPCWSIDTLGVDGTHLIYNPEFIVDLAKNKEHLRTVIGMHEAMHDAHGHHLRRGNRDMAGWNIACDWAINEIIVKSGGVLPPCGLMLGVLPGGKKLKVPEDKSPEFYYELLPKEWKDGSKRGHGDPGGCGGVLPPPGGWSEAALKEAQARHLERVALAKRNAETRGKLPGHLSDLIEEMLSPKVPWQEVLRPFLTKAAATEYSWKRPDRRYASQGIYLPTMMGEAIGAIVASVDTSGSCWSHEDQVAFASEIQGILTPYDVTVHIVYHDTKVQAVEVWKPSDGKLVLRPQGGGGTSHLCVFDWIEQQEWKPACLIALTDMESEFPKDAPEYPVMWCTVRDCKKAPFGELLEIS